jgi:hypothetical protein
MDDVEPRRGQAAEPVVDGDSVVPLEPDTLPRPRRGRRIAAAVVALALVGVAAGAVVYAARDDEPSSIDAEAATTDHDAVPTGPTSGSSGVPDASNEAEVRIEVTTCLRSKGLNVPATTAPSLQYPPEVALAAWQGCRDIYAARIHIPAEGLAFLECMAGLGWLYVPGTPGLTELSPPVDMADYNAANQRCQLAPGSPQSDPKTVLTACLRSKGLNVPDPPAPFPHYPPEAALAAWQGCRDPFAARTNMPADILARLDCLAGQGWIANFSPPADVAGYDAASQRCQPTPG